MKVYELMDALSKLPSGLEVSCSAALTVNELESGSHMGKIDGEMIYAVSKDLDCVDDDEHRVFLSF